MLLPEIILQDLTKKLLDITNADWTDPAVKPKRKLLTQLFGTDDNGNELKVDNFSYLEGAKSIFLNNQSIARQLKVNFGYNRNREGLPTIHILLPQENSNNNSIGLGEEVEFDDEDQEEGYDESNYGSTTGYVTKAYAYQTSFNFMISSDNSHEVLIIYYWLRNMLVASSDHLELSGLQNIKLGGQDLSLSQELVSPGVFHRNLQLSFQYENKIVTNITQIVRKGLHVLKS
jgi:hypothetical protein